jgi:GT2 family glycosyltransferase
MDLPTTTILVPTIGRTEFFTDVRRCIEAQTRTDFRVLVLDNASPPAAQELFGAWAAADPRVEVLRADPRVPMFSNFNRGMQACRTKYVTFFHDDDVYRPRFLEALVGALEASPGAAFAGSNYDFVDERGETIEVRRWIARTAHWSPSRYVEELVGRGRNPVAMSGLVFRRSAFGPGGFDETLPIHYGDFVLLLRAAEDGGLVVDTAPLMAIRRHAGQASATSLSRMIPLRTELLLDYLDEFLTRHPAEGALVARMRRRVELSHRIAMVWGWVNNEDHAEREACLETLGERPLDTALRQVLRWVDHHGLRPSGLGSKVDRIARRAAATFRL